MYSHLSYKEQKKDLNSSLAEARKSSDSIEGLSRKKPLSSLGFFIPSWLKPALLSYVPTLVSRTIHRWSMSFNDYYI